MMLNMDFVIRLLVAGILGTIIGLGMFDEYPDQLMFRRICGNIYRMANCLNSCNIFFIKQRFLYYNNKISHKLNIFNAYSEI